MRHTWGGSSEQAVVHGLEATRLAREVGGDARVEATGLHLAGRAMLESVSIFPLCRVFPEPSSIDLQTKNRLIEGARLLHESGVVEHREHRILSEAFSVQRESRGLLCTRDAGSLYDARQLDSHWQTLFEREEHAAEARLDRVKRMLLDTDDPARYLNAAENVLRKIREPFADWGYAAGLAEAAITRVYVDFLGGDFRRDSRARQDILESGLSAILLHPHKEHPNFQVTWALLSIVQEDISDHEWEAYCADLEHRISERDADSHYLDHAYTYNDTLARRLITYLPMLRARH